VLLKELCSIERTFVPLKERFFHCLGAREIYKNDIKDQKNVKVYNFVIDKYVLISVSLTWIISKKSA